MTARTILFAVAAAGFLSACAERQMKVGAYKSGLVVEAEGPTQDEAHRRAVAGLFELFLSSQALASQGPLLEEKILSRAGALIARDKVVSPKKGVGTVRLRALIPLEKLGRELDGLGLVKPGGVAGRPLMLIRLIESGPGAGFHSSSEALRRALSERGYSAVDLSSSTKAAADSQASGLKEGALIMGTAQTTALDDSRLEGYSPVSARLALKAVAAPAAEPLDEFTTEASAIDAAQPAAGAKALAAAGEIAAAKLRRALSERFRERSEISVLFVGLGGADKAGKLLADLRARPSVAGAAVDSLIGDDVKVRVFTENLTTDDLAAALLRLPGRAFSVRLVESDYRYVELEAASGAF